MKHLLYGCIAFGVMITSCHRRHIPEATNTTETTNTTTTTNTTGETTPVAPVYKRPVIIVDSRGNFTVTDSTLPAGASKTILNPANARAYTPAQTKTLAYRFGKVPPRILYVPTALEKKSAKGTYYVLEKKFWYWKKSNGYFYIDENYFK